VRKILIISCLLLPSIVWAGNGQQDLYWYGLIPAIVSILLAILTKQVLVSLFVGVTTGSIINYLTTNSDSYFFGIDKVFDRYLLNSITDKGHASVILFSLLIAGSIHLIAKMGAFNGLVFWLSKYAKSKRSALLITYFMGFFVFFDDYANTLVVGNTMRKITDKFKISREKLAFIVDATAAPIASIAFVSTWIGYEVELIGDGLQNSPIAGVDNAYGVFLNSIGYSFYPILILVFILILILSKKDFGPMLKFEKFTVPKQSKTDEENKVVSPVLAVIPILVLLFTTIFGIYITGDEGGGVVNAIQTGDCYKGLIWGSSACFVLSFSISLFLRNKLSNTINWVLEGMKDLFSALVILILAWALNSNLEDLQLGKYLGGIITQSNLSFEMMPALVFVLSGITAFSTGSSFSTMGILIPIVVAICSEFLNHDFSDLTILYASIASVLSGAVMGDHCSPISDTTVLSSMATGCNHINHVNSQLTYCLLIGVVSLVFIVINSVLHINVVLTYIIAFLVIYLIIRLFGK